jgi:phosphoribosylamine--glycine ligase / phosphoribosylformylglycinamidine cyclo-ligase
MLKVLLVGSGGREHVLAWKLAQSPQRLQLSIAPGNAGTAQLGENVPISAENATALVNFAYSNSIDLVIVGPEAPLAAGLVDNLQTMHIPVFGPTREAAQIEASKAFAKDFMAQHGIPTPRYATFRDFEQALIYLRRQDTRVVIKASGLAAGKGVLVPETQAEAEAGLRAMMLSGEFGQAGQQVVIEERLEGEEISLLVFTDGEAIRVMPPAQDHKRLLDGDRGPNTGGMGAYAPTPLCPPALAEEAVRTILQPTVDGLRQAGMPFVGVLYAGLMNTSQGLQVLEFNSRFGDPETQAILPLLETDLLEVIQACVEKRLGKMQITWKPMTAACITIASEGYPSSKYATGRPIHGLDKAPVDAMVFHAGTKVENGLVVTAGGRALSVTGIGADLPAALAAAYQAISEISFEGMQYRGDIGRRAISPAYAAAGVNIDAGNRAVNLMQEAVHSTYSPQVLAGLGAFGGMFDASEVQAMRRPVLVASTDGVGTKVKLAAAAGRYESIGEDLVNHCINDILVQGARPLFFLDYFATSKLKPEVVVEVVQGIAKACRQCGCALIGGETAEMPGVYAAGEFDVAGTIVGVVEGARILPRHDLQAGDVLIGLRSSGPHTNGYSLIHKIFEAVPLTQIYPELGIPVGEALLAPHRSYFPLLHPLISTAASPVKALVHLTGGGFVENIPRILPEGLGAVVHLGSWPVPALFKLIQERGNVAEAEMYRVFNMGIGMLAVVAAEEVEAVRAAIPEDTWVIGELVTGERMVRLQ